MNCSSSRDGSVEVRLSAAVNQASRIGWQTATPCDDDTRHAFERIWESIGLGDHRVSVAILDGPIDYGHESLRDANIRPLGRHSAPRSDGVASRHATLIASIIFGNGSLHGLAPGCRGLGVEVFADGDDEAPPSCSQAQLSEAINNAVDAGVQVINISAGEAAQGAVVESSLARAIDRATNSGVLIVAAAGDGGCCDRQLPSSLEPVLAVSGDGSRSGSESTCFTEYCTSVPATDILGASPGGGLITATGSSYACAIVSAFAALLLSAQVRREGETDSALVRQVIGSATRAQDGEPGGTLDVSRAWDELLRGRPVHARPSNPEPAASFVHHNPSSSTDVEVSDWALRTKFRGVERDRFGSIDVILPTGRHNVVDLKYPVGDEPKGMRIVPASDESRVVFPDGILRSGHDLIDHFLRQEMGLLPDEPIYAVFSYIHPEEHVGDIAALPQTAKLYFGHQHIAAYLGGGRTTHALSPSSRWRGSRPANMALNLDRHPANVQIVSLQGVPQGTLNRNAQIVDTIISTRARIPISTDTIDCRTVDLTTILQYYRDLIKGEEYLEDLSWYTNCSVHKTIVVNAALNVPHNPKAFEEIFGPDGRNLCSIFLDCYAEVAGQPFSPSLETDFVPLWKLEGLPRTAVRPLSLREYNRYHAAVAERRLREYGGRRPLPPNEGLAWPLETLPDILGSFVETYAPLRHVGGLEAASAALLLRNVVRERVGIDEATYIRLARPVVTRMLVAESLRQGSADLSTTWLDDAPAQLQDRILQGDRLYTGVDSSAVREAVDQCAADAKEMLAPLLERLPIDDDEALRWFRESVHEDMRALRAASVTDGGKKGLCSSPGIFHKLALGRHAISRYVQVRTVCTVMDESHLTHVPSDHRTRLAGLTTSGIGTSSTEAAMEESSTSGGQGGGMETAQPVPRDAAPANVPVPSRLLPTPPDDLVSSTSRAGVRPAAASNEPAAGQLVYALGQVGYDFPSRARRDSLMQLLGDEGDAELPRRIVDYLDAHPADATAIQWVLELEGLPLYFLYPTGHFATETYAMLRRFLREQLEEGVERVSIPGTIVGVAPHRAGMDLPVVAPELRGMYSWTIEALVESLGASAEGGNGADEAPGTDVRAGVSSFLERVYFELRNPGLLPQERALNYAATNAFSIERVYEQAVRENLELDSIEVEESPYGPPGSSIWDVKLIFFFPDRPPQSVRRLYRFTVSVEDVVPTTIGPVRSWSIR